jgi:hypothetical protein
MPDTALPITYKTSVSTWVRLIGVFVVSEIAFIGIIVQGDPKYTGLGFFGAVLYLLGSTYAFVIASVTVLEVSEKGFYYSALTISREMEWSQVQKVEMGKTVRRRLLFAGESTPNPGLLFIPGDASYSLSISSNPDEKPARIWVTSFRKEDLRQFITLLRKKAPQARVEPEVLSWMK